VISRRARFVDTHDGAVPSLAEGLLPRLLRSPHERVKRGVRQRRGGCVARREPLNDPAAVKARLDLTTLADRHWVTFDRDHGLAEWLVTACAQAGFVPKSTTRLAEVAAAVGLAAAGLGPTFVPANVVPPGLDAAVCRLQKPVYRTVAAYARTKIPDTARGDKASREPLWAKTFQRLDRSQVGGRLHLDIKGRAESGEGPVSAYDLNRLNDLPIAEACPEVSEDSVGNTGVVDDALNETD
jgi:hypothetical protein